MKMRARAAGFTLLELLVVLAVAGFMMAGVAAFGAKSLPGTRMKSAVQKLADDLRNAQSQSIASGLPVTLALNPAQELYLIEPGGTITALPPGMTISFTPFTFLKGQLVGVRFFPDGSATGGHIDLTSPARSFSITIDWLTGRVASNA